jgi:alkylation response protein AidB-like acyl-CoA dehydrogenase
MNRAALDPSSLPTAHERELLRESVRGFLQEHWPSDRAVALAADADALRRLWAGLAGQGLTALGQDPEQGGLREACVVMEELGRGACPVPFAAAVVLNLFGDAADRDAIAAGDCIPAIELSIASPVRVKPVEADTSPDQAEPVEALRCIDGGLAATHLFRQAGDGFERIDLSSPGVVVEPARAMGGPGWASISLPLRERVGEGARAAETSAVPTSTPDRPLPTLPRRGREQATVLRLLLAARAHGAARRAFELAVDYAKERHQFGQPIGRFQAIQHKLANGLIALEGVRLGIEHAATQFDLGRTDWTYFADAAFAFAGDALRQVSLETHHAFGAIGYAEEHEAPRHFRRVHLDCVQLGGVADARQRLASRFLDEGLALPEYDLGEAGNAFREEVRAWLHEHWSGARKSAYDARPFHDREYDEAFARDFGRTGWNGAAWPKEHGGQGRTPLEQVALMEMLEKAEAPRVGGAVQANAFMQHGTPEQQRRYLPGILRGEAMHGMGYSEPQAGSDLASLKTRAVRDGDGWVIDGQKIWTTTWWGKYMFLAARTDPQAKPPHAGISMFVVPMDTAGITVKPATTMYDGSFANIFYDGVRVPADALVGALNGGWKVLTDALATERGLVGGGIVLKVAHAFELLCADIRERGLQRDPLVRDRIGRLAGEIEVGRQLMIHCAELAAGGTTPPEMGAISKVFSGELMERFGEAALDILGPEAALSQESPGCIRRGRYEQNLRHSLMWVISIGTNEIQRSLIAQRGLGLPR